MADVRPQVIVGPEIEAGVNGTLLTAKVLAGETPQVLEAVTEILPLLKTALLIVVAMLVVKDVPEKPEGNTQLYCVAPVDAELV